SDLAEAYNSRRQTALGVGIASLVGIGVGVYLAAGPGRPSNPDLDISTCPIGDTTCASQRIAQHDAAVKAADDDARPYLVDALVHPREPDDRAHLAATVVDRLGDRGFRVDGFRARLHRTAGVLFEVARLDRLVVLPRQAGHALAERDRRSDLLHLGRNVDRR